MCHSSFCIIKEFGKGVLIVHICEIWQKSAFPPKVLIFGLLVRTGTINDFSSLTCFKQMTIDLRLSLYEKSIEKSILDCSGFSLKAKDCRPTRALYPILVLLFLFGLVLVQEERLCQA